MKKIEQQICEAFNAAIHNVGGGSKLSESDRVAHHLIFKSDYYYHHDSCIFWYNHKQQRFGFSLRGYNTVTTRSRLRALLDYFCDSDLYMKQGKVYLEQDGKKHEVDANGIYFIERRINL